MPISSDAEDADPARHPADLPIARRVPTPSRVGRPRNYAHSTPVARAGLAILLVGAVTLVLPPDTVFTHVFTALTGARHWVLGVVLVVAGVVCLATQVKGTADRPGG